MHRILIAAIVSSIALPALAFPGVVAHQGRLLAGDDTPINGERKLLFRVWPAPTAESTGGTDVLWESALDVRIGNGTYAVLLGDQDPFPDGLFDGDRWLSVTIDGTELLPRLRIGSSPSAHHARVASKALDLECEGCVSSDEIAGVDGSRIAPTSLPWSALAPLPAEPPQIANLGRTHDHDDRYWAKDDFGENGAAAVDWKRLTNVPPATEGMSAGTGIDIDGTEISVRFGTTSQTVAAGDHRHDGVYAQIGTDGLIELVGAPTAPNHAATKQYVDDALLEGTAARPAKSCRALARKFPHLPSGPYVIDRGAAGPITQYCDLEKDDGGWARCLAWQSEAPEQYSKRLLNDGLGQVNGRVTPTELAANCNRGGPVEYRIETYLDGELRSSTIFTAGANAFAPGAHVRFPVVSSVGPSPTSFVCFNGTSASQAGCHGSGAFGSRALYLGNATYADGGTAVGGYNYLYVEGRGWHPSTGDNWNGSTSLAIVLWVRSEDDSVSLARPFFDGTGIFASSEQSYTAAQYIALLGNEAQAKAACPPGYHPGNAWEYAVYGILTQAELAGHWVAGGFPDGNHYHSLVNAQDNTVCPENIPLLTYRNYRGVFGRVHCASPDDTRRMLCVADRP